MYSQVSNDYRLMKYLIGAVLLTHFCWLHLAHANPYLAKPGDAPATVRVAACAITGGFIHLYTALDNGLFGKYGMTVEFVSIRGSGVGFAEAALVTPPLDVRGRRDGFNLVYRLNDLALPAVYSSLHTNAKILRDRPLWAQKWAAVLAESIAFVEKNPDRAKSAVAKALKCRRRYRGRPRPRHQRAP
jgi:ABC-type nitrate/sulfonate/bicarbonate transport system substrate-binding protein